MTIHLLDNTLHIEIFYACEDHDLEDNVCLKVIERCPPAEKLLRAGETHLYLTPGEARELGEALLKAARLSNTDQP